MNSKSLWRYVMFCAYIINQPMHIYGAYYKKKYSPSLHNFTVAIRNGSYMFRLQSSHKQAYISEL